MRIDVWSDVVCPWCYLGMKRLEIALDGLDFGAEVEVHWRAFLLDPSATEEPRDLEAAIDRKYGPGSFVGMSKRLGGLGEEIGLDYRFDKAVRVSSVRAHNLLAWTERTEGSATAARLHERLFEAYFTNGENIADPAILTAAAESVGLDAALVSEVVAVPDASDAVLADFEEARNRDVTGVPAFVVNDTLLIPGAQDVDTIQNLLTRIYEKSKA